MQLGLSWETCTRWRDHRYDAVFVNPEVDHRANVKPPSPDSLAVCLALVADAVGALPEVVGLTLEQQDVRVVCQAVETS